MNNDYVTMDYIRQQLERPSKLRAVCCFVRAVFVWLIAVAVCVALFAGILWLLYWIFPVTQPFVPEAFADFHIERVEPLPTISATVTAYTSSVDETDDTPFITASGARTRRGIIACPPKYPFGTQLKVEDKVFVCEDRMNRRYHDQERFDVWVESKTEAYSWGEKSLEIVLLTHGG